MSSSSNKTPPTTQHTSTADSTSENESERRKTANKICRRQETAQKKKKQKTYRKRPKEGPKKTKTDNQPSEMLACRSHRLSNACRQMYTNFKQQATLLSKKKRDVEQSLQATAYHGEITGSHRSVTKKRYKNNAPTKLI